MSNAEFSIQTALVSANENGRQPTPVVFRKLTKLGTGAALVSTLLAAFAPNLILNNHKQKS